MSGVYVHGYGAVSPAGWDVASLRQTLRGGIAIPVKDLRRPGWTKPLRVRQVPPPRQRPEFLSHSRLRRASSITQHVVAAALEAIGTDVALVANGALSLGVVLCVMSGCVNYSRRFYDEVLRDPGTASPLVFPETVFNAPASHLASLLGTPALNYTLVGDPGTFLSGLALGANWLAEGRVDACVIIGAEEADWLTSDAFHLFSRSIILSDGAGALYLKNDAQAGAMAELKCVTDCHLFVRLPDRARAARQARGQLPRSGTDQLLSDGLQNVMHLDAAETAAWQDWKGGRVSPKTTLGEGLMAAAAWQCVAAVDSLRENYTGANVSVIGCNQQAIGAHFARVKAS